MQNLQDREFSTFDVVKILDIRRERLREWMKAKYVIPTKAAEGVGTKAIFSIFDIYKIAVFKELVTHSVKRKTADHYLLFLFSKITNFEEAEKINFLVIRSGKSRELHTVCVSDLSELYEKLIDYEDWEYSILLNFKSIREKVKDAIKLL